MITQWKHLTLEQRVEIAHGLAHGEPLKSIAERLGMDPTSVSREVRRKRIPSVIVKLSRPAR